MTPPSHLFIDISSHGFGHLAITAPVLNTLAEIAPDLRLTVRTRVPRYKLLQRIHSPFQLIETSTDFGYAMIDATRIDLPASAAVYRQAHADWPARVAEEASFLSQLKPDLVLTNVSYLPLAGAAAAGIRAISLCSLNWADLFAHFFGRETWAASIHAEMLAAYRSADAFLRITPGMPMDDLGNVRAVSTITTLGRAHDLGLSGDKAVLVAMGGIAHRLPLEQWPRLPGLRWLVPGDWQCTHPDAIDFRRFGLSFADLLCSVDAIITKPGYGTFTEAAANGTPVLYQRREDWPEQDCLIEWLAQNGRSREIDAGLLENGQLYGELAALWRQASPPRPSVSGARQVAEIIVGLLGAGPVPVAAG